jgi:hypothetical protein
MTDTFTCAIEDADRKGARRCLEQCPSCKTTERGKEIEVTLDLKTHRHGPLSRETVTLLNFIDRAEELRREVNAFKVKVPSSCRSYCDKAAEAMKDLVNRLRAAVGEQVVADHLGVKVEERKF